jgi:hypothetical protein
MLKLNRKLTWIIATSICSTCMTISNKLILDRLNFPLALTACQLFVAFVITGSKLISIGFTKLRLREFLLYTLEAVLFATSLYSNLQALMRTSVGSVIVGRSVVPLLTFTAEKLSTAKTSAVGRPIRSIISLICVSVFTSLYALTDGKIHVSSTAAATWLSVWVCLVALQMLFGKWLISAVAIGRLERVFYTNSCALPLVFALSMPELTLLQRNGIAAKPQIVLLVLFSCFIGVAISYCSWRLRELVSATSFGLIGVVNKMFTICVSAFIWPASFSVRGTLALVGCVTSAMMYS